MEAVAALLDRTANLTPKTAFQFALETIREAIATGAIKEGEPLLQNDLAAALGVSRMPVREALRKLEAEGRVEFLPYKGAVVAGLSSTELIECFEMRFALESLALRKSLRVISDQAFENAEEVLKILDAELDIARSVDLNQKFHLALYGGAGRRLIDAIRSQYAAAERYLRIELQTLDNAAESQAEHREILEACRQRDIERALALLEPHIVEAGRDLAAALERRRGGAA